VWYYSRVLPLRGQQSLLLVVCALLESSLSPEGDNTVCCKLCVCVLLESSFSPAGTTKSVVSCVCVIRVGSSPAGTTQSVVSCVCVIRVKFFPCGDNKVRCKLCLCY